MPKNCLLIGLTGSGKTKILKKIGLLGHQVIDLEAICSHTGSSFGGLNSGFLLSQNEFEQLLKQKIASFIDSKSVWSEFKGSNLGALKMPNWFFDWQENSFKIWVETPLSLRIANILEDYQHVSMSQFEEIIDKMKLRMLRQHFEQAKGCLSDNDRAGFIEWMMAHFDETPTYKNLKKSADYILTVNSSNYAEATIRLLQHLT